MSERGASVPYNTKTHACASQACAFQKPLHLAGQTGVSAGTSFLGEKWAAVSETAAWLEREKKSVSSRTPRNVEKNRKVSETTPYVGKRGEELGDSRHMWEGIAKEFQQHPIWTGEN